MLNEAFFNEIAVRLPQPAVPIVEALAEKGVLAGVPVSRLTQGADDVVLMAATETTTEDDIAQLQSALKEVLA